MGFSDLAGLLSFAIVLVFVFLALSIIVSTLVETWAATRRLRAKMLRERLATMLDDPAETGLAAMVFNSPLIRSQSADGQFPSYLPPKLFADAVLSLLGPDPAKPSDLHPLLRALAPGGLANDADRNQLRQKLIELYEASGERLNGSYKRMTGVRLFVFGLTMAVVFDINMLMIIDRLWDQRTKLDASVGAIEEVMKAHEARSAEREESGTSGDEGGDETGEAPEGTPHAQSGDPDEQLRREIEALVLKDSTLASLNLPVGRTLFDPECSEDGAEATSSGSAEGRPVCGLWSALERQWANAGLSSVIGWFLTALVLVPGSAFWFDALGRLISLRATGPKPEKGTTV